MKTTSTLAQMLNQKPAQGLDVIPKPKAEMSPWALAKLHAQRPAEVPEFAHLNMKNPMQIRPMLERGKDIAPGMWPKVLSLKRMKHG